jgi:tRNA 2-thiouridine synthesizing protein E
MNPIECDGRRVETDARGYLRNLDDWSEALAIEMARHDGIVLTEAHWEVLRFLRAYYAEYRLAPPMRLLVRELAQRLGAEKGQSRYLYRLFPEGPAKQACRYAGLPKPVSCI